MANEIEKIDDDISRMTDAEMIDEHRRVIAELRPQIGTNPLVTPELLKQTEEQLADFEREVEKCKIADREAAIATAKMEASADKYLSALDQIERRSIGPEAMNRKKGN